MSKLFLTPIDLGGLELLNAKFQILAADPGSPEEGDFWYNSTSKTFKFYTGTVIIVLGRLDQISAPTASVAMNSQKITGMLDPTAAQDAATKAYVDAFVNGLNWKDAVRVASTANVVIASALENGDTVDGVVLVTGDRVLLKNQTAPEENGIYVAAASGAAARSLDADSAADILQAAMFVQEGTAGADTAWILTTNAPITLGTTGLTFAQFGAGSAYTAGDGIDVTGTVISLDIPVAIIHGGTGAITAAAAKTNLGFMTRFAANVGDGAAVSFNVDHNLGTLDVHVSVHRVSDGVEVITDITRSTTNRVIVAFAEIPTTNQYRVVVIG